MRFLVLEAYVTLIEFDLCLMRRDFKSVYARVRSCPVRKKSKFTYSAEEICSAMSMASIWYWKEALCLQRSAATVCLLRRYGFQGELVIGAQQMPFKAHAWVEVDGCVINDKAYMREMYLVVDKC